MSNEKPTVNDFAMFEKFEKGNENVRFLSGDVNQAVRELMTFTQTLIDYTDQEAQSLLQQDVIGFAAIQDDKAHSAWRYNRASQEFRSRINEFKEADKGLLKKLENLQGLLHDKTQGNNIIVKNIRDNAQIKTRAHTVTAQQMGRRVKFNRPGMAGNDAGRQVRQNAAQSNAARGIMQHNPLSALTLALKNSEESTETKR